jgi:hypothetical protein
MGKINLDNITLISVCHNKYLNKTIKAAKHCSEYINFNCIKILSNTNIIIDGIQIIQIPNIDSLEKYNSFIISELYKYINTEFCINFQWDGFIINPLLWKNEFLDYDYIGAPWGFKEDCRNRIGNGGFSLRSKKFLDVSSRVNYTPYEFDTYTPLLKHDRPIAPEDWFLCYHSYNFMIDNKIKFPSIELAYDFSVEHPSHMRHFDRNNLYSYNSFGFHGDLNTAAMSLIH